MTIERLHFEDGHPLNLSGSPEGQIARILVENFSKIQILPEGDYDLTPKWWTKHLMNHNLTVLENGGGIYRATPRDGDVGTRDLSRGGQYKPGGNIIHLPQDKIIIIVAGPLKDRKTIGVYEIVRYIPGSSPKKEPNQAKQ